MNLEKSDFNDKNKLLVVRKNKINVVKLFILFWQQ